MNSDQMKAQGARCPCGGSDDYCVCQNVDLAALREQQKETAKDTYFAIAEYKTRIDWFEAQVAALTAERDEARHHYDCVVVSWAECRQRAEKAECHEDAQRSTIGMLTRRAERAEAKVAALTAAAEHQMHHTEVVRRNAEASEASAAELRTALEDAAEALRQLEVIGPTPEGEIWLHLRPGKGLVSIRITEAPMVEAYLDWFARVKRARAAIAAKVPPHRPFGDRGIQTEDTPPPLLPVAANVTIPAKGEG